MSLKCLALLNITIRICFKISESLLEYGLCCVCVVYGVSFLSSRSDASGAGQVLFPGHPAVSTHVPIISQTPAGQLSSSRLLQSVRGKDLSDEQCLGSVLHWEGTYPQKFFGNIFCFGQHLVGLLNPLHDPGNKPL